MSGIFSAITLCLAASVTAFAPSTTKNGASTTILNDFNPRTEIGAQMPAGYFDPLNLVKKGPYGSPEENFYHYRGIELKHGRIAMAATVGMLTQQVTRFEGFVSPSQNIKFADVPNGLGALKGLPLEGWVQLVVLIGAHEVLVKPNLKKKAGDYGAGYFGVNLEDGGDKQRQALSVEVANGRLGKKHEIIQQPISIYAVLLSLLLMNVDDCLLYILLWMIKS